LIFIGKWIFESFYLDKRNSLHVAVSGVVTGMGFCHLAVFVSFLILKKIDQFQNKEKVG